MWWSCCWVFLVIWQNNKWAPSNKLSWPILHHEGAVCSTVKLLIYTLADDTLHIYSVMILFMKFMYFPTFPRFLSFSRKISLQNKVGCIISSLPFQLVHHYMEMFAVWGLWAYDKHKTTTISKLKSIFKPATKTSTNLVFDVSHFLDSKLRPVVNLLFAGQWTGGESSINQQRTSAVTSISARSGIIQQMMIFVDLVLDGEKIWKNYNCLFQVMEAK